MLSNLLKAKLVKKNYIVMHGRDNIMVILSSPSGVGKTTITKKIQQKYHSLKYQFHIPRDPLDPMKLKVLTIILFHTKNLKLINENKFYEYAKIFDHYYELEKNRR